MNKKKRCYTYLRVSTEKQVDGYLIDAQRKNVQNRPAFTQMMKDIEQEKDSIIIPVQSITERKGNTDAHIQRDGGKIR